MFVSSIYLKKSNTHNLNGTMEMKFQWKVYLKKTCWGNEQCTWPAVPDISFVFLFYRSNIFPPLGDANGQDEQEKIIVTCCSYNLYSPFPRSNIFPHSAMPVGKTSKADTMTKSLSLLLNKVRPCSLRIILKLNLS